MGIFG